jgi:hypothetical protein
MDTVTTAEHLTVPSPCFPWASSQEPCSDPSPQPFSLSQDVAEALWRAVDAKEAVNAAELLYKEACMALDLLVADGRLPEKGLPTVNGFTVYRQEGRKSWTYPESIKVLQTALKKRMELAQQLGEAVAKRGDSFWTIKEEPRGEQP